MHPLCTYRLILVDQLFVSSFTSINSVCRPSMSKIAFFLNILKHSGCHKLNLCFLGKMVLKPNDIWTWEIKVEWQIISSFSKEMIKSWLNGLSFSGDVCFISPRLSHFSLWVFVTTYYHIEQIRCSQLTHFWCLNGLFKDQTVLENSLGISACNAFLHSQSIPMLEKVIILVPHFEKMVL